jgi:serine/threonine protein phosphatase 1
VLGFLRRRRDGGSPPRVAADCRIYAIGDVHGRADLLDALLAAIAADAARFADGRAARLVLLGDYVDRGEASAAVLARVAALRQAGAVCLRGNHEAALLAFLADPGDAGWLAMGGLQTLASFGVRPPNPRDRRAVAAAAAALGAALGPALAFLENDLVTFHESGDVVFVHAALAPAVPLPAQDEADMLWGNSRFLERAWQKGRLVVHGHYAAPAPVQAPGRICVDTGAFYSGRLTAVRLDEGVAFLSAGA